MREVHHHISCSSSFLCAKAEGVLRNRDSEVPHPRTAPAVPSPVLECPSVLDLLAAWSLRADLLADSSVQEQQLAAPSTLAISTPPSKFFFETNYKDKCKSIAHSATLNKTAGKKHFQWTTKGPDSLNPPFEVEDRLTNPHRVLSLGEANTLKITAGNPSDRSTCAHQFLQTWPCRPMARQGVHNRANVTVVSTTT